MSQEERQLLGIGFVLIIAIAGYFVGNLIKHSQRIKIAKSGAKRRDSEITRIFNRTEDESKSDAAKYKILKERYGIFFHPATWRNDKSSIRVCFRKSFLYNPELLGSHIYLATFGGSSEEEVRKSVERKVKCCDCYDCRDERLYAPEYFKEGEL